MSYWNLINNYSFNRTENRINDFTRFVGSNVGGDWVKFWYVNERAATKKFIVGALQGETATCLKVGCVTYDKKFITCFLNETVLLSKDRCPTLGGDIDSVSERAWSRDYDVVQKMVKSNQKFSPKDVRQCLGLFERGELHPGSEINSAVHRLRGEILNMLDTVLPLPSDVVKWILAPMILSSQ
jgi:hypothetical protein